MHDPFGLVGTTIDRRYRVLRAVAEGGYGVVYEADAIALDQRVALKVLRASGSSGAPSQVAMASDARARFEQEARLLARLRHPAIVALADASCLDDGTPYLVLEWLVGETLDALLQRRGALPLDETIALLSPVAAAITYAHSMSIVHRDLKPSNLMVTANGTKVFDFGIARWSSALAVKTSTGALAGVSIGFAAPEQYGRELGSIDGRTDQFALAAIVYATLTGEAPFRGDSPAEVLFSTCMSVDRPSPRRVRPELSVEVDAALKRALSIRADDRFASVDDFWTALAGPRSLPPATPIEPSIKTDPQPPQTAAKGAPPDATTLPSPLLLRPVAPRDEAPRAVSSSAQAHPTLDAAAAPATKHEPTGTLREGMSDPASSERATSSRRASAWGRIGFVALVGCLGVVAPSAYFLMSRGILPNIFASAAPPPSPRRRDPTSAGTPKIGGAIASVTNLSTSASAPLAQACDEHSEREECTRATRFRRGPDDCDSGPDDVAHRTTCPAREAIVGAFAIDRFEVTRARYDVCVAEKKCVAMAGSEAPTMPVRGLEYADALRFCRFDGGRRLPSDDEWELTAGGSAHSLFPWGNAPATERLAIFSDDGSPRTQPSLVGSVRAGDTPTGVVDLAGNVAEWTSTSAPPSAPLPEELSRPSDDAGSDSALRKRAPRRWVRGGSFASPWDALRTWTREAYPETAQSPRVGFRCARSLGASGVDKAPAP